MKAKSTIFHQLKKKIRQPANGHFEEIHFPKIPRRQFVKKSLIAGAGLAVGTSFFSCKNNSSQPRIAIIGAGLAGLTAGFYLKKQNLPFTIYEGSSRVGGRTFTLKDFAAPGTWTEMGGQYIDTSHKAILDLCRELNIPLLDVQSPGEMALIQMDYFFNGTRYTDQDIIEEFASVAPFFEKDIASFPEVINYRTPQFRELDNTSLEAYIEQSGASPLMRSVLKAAFTCEYGRDLSEQSALNMIYLLPPKVNGQEFEAWGGSDERYVVEGGSSVISETMAELMQEQLAFEQLLEAISPDGQGYRLSFQGGKEVKADVVIITIPFTMLRNVDIRLDLPPQKKQAIQELGYGMNSKLAMGFDERVWRKQGFTGNIFNEQLQNGWENTQMQQNNEGPGSFTVFLGGAAGKELSIEQNPEFVNLIEQAYPGCRAVFNDRKFIFNWSANLFVKGSYTCYLPGQWTAFGGAEAEQAGNLFFAGEHCSLDSQGFMNGAVESGKRAAEAILKNLKS